MSKSWEIALWTLHQESCVVINNLLIAESDSRVVFSDAAELVDFGFIDRGGKPTDYFHQQVKTWVFEWEVRATLRLIEKAGRWRFRGNYVVSESTKSRLLRHRVVWIIQWGLLQIDSEGRITNVHHRQ